MFSGNDYVYVHIFCLFLISKMSPVAGMQGFLDRGCLMKGITSFVMIVSEKYEISTA